MRSWFGLVKQVAHYEQLRGKMAPFKHLLSPKNQFDWTQDLGELFEQTKREIVDAIKEGVQIFDLKSKTCLRPDFSKVGIGYYLCQKHCDCKSELPDCCENGWRVTLAGSRFLEPSEQRFAPVEGEALAVAWA